MSKNYRPEIDGLRAIAVIAIILFHAKFNIFSGGFVGVDIFFVISGYLITSIILRKKIDGSFSLSEFYESRARRILPALFFVMLLCLPFAWFWMTPKHLEDFGLSMIATSTFWSNYLFYIESRDYFGGSSELMPLLHTWSLSVEEQFYIMYPLILIFLYNKKWFLVISISVVSITSLLFAQWGGNFNFSYPYINDFEFYSTPSWANFYLLTGRVWEFGLGAFAAFYMSRKTINKNNQLSIIGFLLILYSILFFKSETPHPSFYTMVPTIGTLLIILYASPGTTINKLLSTRYFVSIGLISYSAYLFHWPLFVFSRIYFLGGPSSFGYFSFSILGFILAYLSTRYIENPFRNRLIINKKILYISLSSVLILIVLLGSLAVFNNGFEGRYSKLIKNYPSINFNNVDLSNLREEYLINYSKTEFPKTHEKLNVLIVGNSHAKDLYIALNQNTELFPQFEFAYYLSKDLDREDWENFQIKYFLQSNNKEKVESKRFVDSNLFRSANIILVATRYKSKDDINAIYNLNLIAKKYNKNLVIAGNTPEYSVVSDPLFDVISKNKEILGNYEIEGAICQLLNNDVSITNSKLISVAKELNLIYLDRFDYSLYLNSTACRGITDKGAKIYFDYAHTTIDGARYFGNIINEIGWLDPLNKLIDMTESK